MPDYQKMYTTLFNAITDALEELEQLHIGRAQNILRTAQQTAEEIYLEEDEETLSAAPKQNA